MNPKPSANIYSKNKSFRGDFFQEWGEKLKCSKGEEENPSQ